jgi:hypothetical protein
MAGVRRVAVVPGVGEGQELLEFLVGLEDVSGEVAGDWIGLVCLVASSSSAADSCARAGAPAELSAPDVLTGTLAGWNSWPLSGVSRPMASSRSVRLCGWAGLAGLPSWELVVLWQGEAGGSNSAGD